VGNRHFKALLLPKMVEIVATHTQHRRGKLQLLSKSGEIILQYVMRFRIFVVLTGIFMNDRILSGPLERLFPVTADQIAGKSIFVS
jgi:hypothetical protein